MFPAQLHTRSRVLVIIAAVTALVASLLAVPVPAQAADLDYEWRDLSGLIVIPPDVYELELQIAGGSGGGTGGAGAQVHAILDVTPGQRLTIRTGKQGRPGTVRRGGEGGDSLKSKFHGGRGGNTQEPPPHESSTGGGGGGSASVIWDADTSEILVVAGGGGGGGGAGSSCPMTLGTRGGRGGQPHGGDPATAADHCTHYSGRAGEGGAHPHTEGESARNPSVIEVGVGGGGGGGAGYPNSGTAGDSNNYAGGGGGGGDSFVDNLRRVPERDSLYGIDDIRLVPHDGVVRGKIYGPSRLDSVVYTHGDGLKITGQVDAPPSPYIVFDFIVYYDGEQASSFPVTYDTMPDGSFTLTYDQVWPGWVTPLQPLPDDNHIEAGKEIRVEIVPWDEEDQLHPGELPPLPDPVTLAGHVRAAQVYTAITEFMVTPESAPHGAERTYTADVQVQEPSAGNGGGTVEFWRVGEGGQLLEKLGEANPEGPEPSTDPGESVRPVTTASITSNVVIDAESRVQAFYLPEPPYQGAQSQSIEVAYAPAATLTEVSIVPRESYYGETATATVTVQSSDGGTATPSGSVTFAGEQKTLDENGQAQFDVSADAVGQHSYEATYDGAAGFEPSSGAGSHTVLALDTSLALRVSGQGYAYGDEVVLEVVAEHERPVTEEVTGSVELWMDGEPTELVASLAASQAEFTVPGLDAGSYEFTAHYVPQEGENPAASELVAVDVAALETVVELEVADGWRGRVASVDSAEVAVGEVEIWATAIASIARRLNLSGAVAQASEGFEGSAASVLSDASVSAESGEQLLATVPLDEGEFTLEAPELEPGRYRVVARYRGAQNFNPSESVIREWVVEAAPDDESEDGGSGGSGDGGSDGSGDAGSGDGGSDGSGDAGSGGGESGGSGDAGSGDGESGGSGDGGTGDGDSGDDGSGDGGSGGDSGSSSNAEESRGAADGSAGTGGGGTGDGAGTGDASGSGKGEDARDEAARPENLPQTGGDPVRPLVLGAVLVIGGGLALMRRRSVFEA